MRRKIKPGDIAVISIVFIAAITLFLCFSIPHKAQSNTLIIKNNGISTSYSLDEDQQFNIAGNSYTLTVEIKNGSARVIKANCPDKTCVHTGKISKKGQNIACVPAKVIITVGKEEDGYDFVAG